MLHANSTINLYFCFSKLLSTMIPPAPELPPGEGNFNFLSVIYFLWNKMVVVCFLKKVKSLIGIKSSCIWSENGKIRFDKKLNGKSVLGAPFFIFSVKVFICQIFLLCSYYRIYEISRCFGNIKESPTG